MNNSKKTKVFRILSFIVIGTLFITFFSISTTPLLKFSIEGDSATFQTIGKYWSLGKVPYKDLWDHKGPVIFWLNSLGYKLTGTKTGVFLLQVFFLVFTECFLFKFLTLEWKRSNAFILTISSLFSLMMTYSEGNSTEEYVLPLLILSFMCMYQWGKQVENGNNKHNPWYAFAYGVTCSFCLLTRMTNAIGVCIGVAVITLWLVSKKEWKNLFNNIGVFILGVCILTVPFTIYFWSKDALYEMWYGTFLYNIQYAKNSSFTLKSTIKENIQLLLGLSNGLGLLVVSLYWSVVNKKEAMRGLLWLFISLGTLVYLLNGNGYLHYSIIMLPYLAVSLLLLKDIAEKNDKYCRMTVVVALVCIEVLTVGSGLLQIKNLKGIYDYYISRTDDIAIYDRLPERDKDSFIAYNGLTNAYLEMDVCPAYQYFILQDWQAAHSEDLKSRIYTTFEQGDVKWILVAGDSSKCAIADILDEKYECKEREVDSFTEIPYELYEHK